MGSQYPGGKLLVNPSSCLPLLIPHPLSVQKPLFGPYSPYRTLLLFMSPLKLLLYLKGVLEVEFPPVGLISLADPAFSLVFVSYQFSGSLHTSSFIISSSGSTGELGRYIQKVLGRGMIVHQQGSMGLCPPHHSDPTVEP